MTWPRVIGQERVKQTLLSAVRRGRLSHAYLFHGLEGVGKDAVALELARLLHCERRGEEACDVCDSCRRMQKLQHPDLRLVVPLPVGRGEQSDDDPMAKLSEPDTRAVQEEFARKAANPYHRIVIPRATVIKINSIRDVRRESAMSTFDGRKRIFIISPADAMGDEAANTLLKTLEEPTADCVFILVTARRAALLPTILSRCQLIRFDPLTEEELRTALVERGEVAPETASFLARLANGSYTRALDLLNAETMRERTHALTFIRHAITLQPGPLMQDIERIAESRDRDFAERFLLLLLTWFRDALVFSHGGAVINVDQVEDIRRFTSRFPAADLQEVIAEVERAISLVRRNVYIKLVFLQLAVRLKRTIARTA